MNILEIIEKKRDNKELSKEEIEYFVNGYTQDIIADYQAAAFIMAVYLNGMTKEETTYLTIAMANSGVVLDLLKYEKVIVDKHSTGGVGDKVSLILLPLVASLGVTVAKMSGRGLGFTGGTIDKLESIPGYRTQIDLKEFEYNVEKIGISIISQTLDLAPADKKLYALRDSISCVESIPLIASSIMSKKIASGAQKIVLDVTVGKGAFMQNMEDAEELSKTMLDIAKLANREAVCILTNMEEPLGYYIGNRLEVIEAIQFLNGNMPEDLKQVVLELGAYMLKLVGIGEDIQQNKEKLLQNILNKKAYEKFLQLIENQDGDVSYIKDLTKFGNAKYVKDIYSLNEGYVQEIDAKKIGNIACELGAGRIRKEDEIDYMAGVILSKKVGDYVEKGEKIAQLHTNREEKVDNIANKMLEIVKISDNKKEKEDTILKIIC